MVSKNNQWEKFQKQTQQRPHYGIRKLTVGVSSVLLGLSFMGGVTATNVKADTVSGDQTANTAVKDVQTTAVNQKDNNSTNTNSVTSVEMPVVKKDQSSNDNQATKQSSSQQKPEQLVNAELAEQKVATANQTTEPEATEVDLQVRQDNGKTDQDYVYPKSGTQLTNGTFQRFGIEGSFVIPKDEITNNNHIKLLTITQSSDTTWKSNFCFEWLPDVYVDGKKIGTLWSDSDWDGTHKPTSITLYINLVDDVSSFDKTDLYVKLNISHAGVFGFRSDLLPLGQLPNHESDVTYTIANGAHKGDSYTIKYVLNQAARDITPNEAANYFGNGQTNPLSIDSTGSAYFIPNNGASSLSLEERQQFAESMGQNYKIDPNYQLPLVAVNIKNSESGFHLDNGGGFWTQGVRIPFYGSDGKLQNATFDGADITTQFHANYTKDFGNNIDIAELIDANYQGIAYSKQNDGSINLVIRAKAGDFKVSDFGINPDGSFKQGGIAYNWLHYNAVVAMDPNPEQAIRNTIAAIEKEGSILPNTNQLIGIDKDNPSVVGETTTSFYNEQNKDQNHPAYVQQTEDAVKKFAMEGQTTINIHYINGLTGAEIKSVESHVGWPDNNKQGHMADHLSINEKSVYGYHYRTTNDNKYLNDQGTDDRNSGSHTGIISENGHQILVNGQSTKLTYPQNGAEDYDLILDPDPQKIIVNYVDEDENNKLIQTDTLNGYSDMKANYNVSGHIPSHYEVDKNVTDINTLNSLVFNENDQKAQTYTVVLKHIHHKNSETKTVTRTVNIISPDEKKTQTNNQITFTRTADVDDVTGQTQYSGWTNGDNGTFNEVTIPAIAGYTPQSDITEDLEKNAKGQYEIKSFHVDQDSNDIVVNVTYGADAQKATITYIDDDETNSDGKQGKVINVQNLSGHTAETISTNVQTAIDNYKKAGYVLDSNDAPDQLTFDNDDHATQTFTVHLGHDHITVTPDQPKEPGDNIPDTNKHFPKGVDHDSLNKTVTRTVNITDPNDKKNQIVNIITFTRTADVDEVTGNVNYGGWSNNDQGTFNAVNIPTFAGYTPQIDPAADLESDSQGQNKVKAFAVNHTSGDITVNVTYGADAQNATITYIDDDETNSNGKQGKVINVQNLSGHTAETISTNVQTAIDNYKKAGYVLDSNDAPDQLTFDNEDHTTQAFTVHLGHGHISVDPKNPKTPSDVIPGTNKYFPKGVDHDSLNKTVTRTVNVTDPNGKKSQKIDQITFTRTAEVDEVTGDVHYSDWTNGNNGDTGKFDETVITSFYGYTPHADYLGKNSKGQYVIRAIAVNHNSNNIIINVTYTADPQVANLNFVDDEGHVELANWDTQSGFSNGPISFSHAEEILKEYLGQGYQFVNVTNDTDHKVVSGNSFEEAAKKFGDFDVLDNVD